MEYNANYSSHYAASAELPNGNKGYLFGHWNDLAAYYLDQKTGTFWSYQNRRFSNRGESLLGSRGWRTNGQPFREYFAQPATPNH